MAALLTVDDDRRELDRLEALASYQVALGETIPELDLLCTLAAQLCRTPYAMVSLSESAAQQVVAQHGMSADFLAAGEFTLCREVVRSGRTLVSSHLDGDDAAATAGMQSYAGVPLTGRDGMTIGTLCVLDRRGRRFSTAQVETLTGLAHQVMTVLAMRRIDRVSSGYEAVRAPVGSDRGRLRRALEDGELVPYYQPIMDLRTGRVALLEALLRWEHPELGTLLPGTFLPAIQVAGMTGPVGRMVLDHACQTLAGLRAAGAPDSLLMTVNIDPRQLDRPGLALDVEAALSRHHLQGGDLGIELVETDAYLDTELACREVRRIREGGTVAVLDDFGVGWSNLRRMVEMPVSGIKLDRSLLADAADWRYSAVIRASMSLAEELQLVVCAEGIETEDNATTMQGLGCQFGQGWLYAKATAVPVLPALLARLGTNPPGFATHAQQGQLWPPGWLG